MLKAKICNKGFLIVERPHGSVKAECPRTCDGNENPYCGDWCPLFGEVVLEPIPATTFTGKAVELVIDDVLTICEDVKFQIVEGD